MFDVDTAVVIFLQILESINAFEDVLVKESCCSLCETCLWLLLVIKIGDQSFGPFLLVIAPITVSVLYEFLVVTLLLVLIRESVPLSIVVLFPRALGSVLGVSC